MNYRAEYKPSTGAAIQFVFLSVFALALFCGVHFVDSRFELGFIRWLAFGCAAMPVIIGLVITFRVSCSNGLQRWIIRDGIIEYVSPNPILGDSFRATVDDVDAIWIDGDSDFAACRLKSNGRTYQIDIRSLAGRKFFELVRACKGNAEQGVAPNRSLPSSLESTSSARASEVV